MNANVDSVTGADTDTRSTNGIPTGQRLRWLLRREYWEHRGGFVWAPLIAGAITLVFTLLGAVGGSLVNARHGNNIQIGDAEPPEIARVLGATGDLTLLGGIAVSMIVLGFVVFFYALGCLYDDRRDRSILFWKSLPVSDAATVASKAIWALLLAPVFALAVGTLIGLALWVIAAFTTTVNGVPGASGLLTHSHPFRVLAYVVSLVPLYALWALPSVGWLMLCSAAARSKPFLWAVIIPVLGCALVSFVSAILGFDSINLGALWYVVAFRGLLSVFPGTWLPRVYDESSLHIRAPEDIPQIIDPLQSWQLAGGTDLWIGAVAGIAMIVLAIRLRRWRDDG